MREALNAFLLRYHHDWFWKMYLSVQNNQCSGIRRFVYICLLKRAMSKHCCDFMIARARKGHFGAYFAGVPFLPHGLNGIVISDQARIGKNCTIFQQVTIGVRNMEGGGAPTIGDNVLIGAGAKVLGEISVGSGAKIGANAVVLENVPEGATVVGNPGRIIKKK